jgi:hypothetical protein
MRLPRKRQDVCAHEVLKYSKPVIRLIRLIFGSSPTMNSRGVQKGQPIKVIYKNNSTYKIVGNFTTGYSTYRQFNIQQFYVLPTAYLCFVWI